MTYKEFLDVVKTMSDDQLSTEICVFDDDESKCYSWVAKFSGGTQRPTLVGVRSKGE